MTASSISTELPAILGGPPSLASASCLGWPCYDAADENAVKEAMRGSAANGADPCRLLEEEVRAWLGVPYAIAHPSGTAAIHAALAALDLRPGDEVIVPSLTFWATVLPIVHAGAVPVFAEIEDETLGLDPRDVEARITVRTRAVIVVHLCGVPADMAALLAICRARGIAIIEDAAHAHGASIGGRPVGTFGDAAIFSFESTKLVPAGEGGVLVTADRKLYERALCFGHANRLGETEHYTRFGATGFGHNFRIAPIVAALARSQLAKLADHNAVRRRMAEPLLSALSRHGFETFLPRRPGRERVFYATVLRVTAGKCPISKRALVRALRAEGLPVVFERYPLVHEQPFFTEGTWRQFGGLSLTGGVGAPAVTLPRTEAVRDEIVGIPVLTKDDPEFSQRIVHAFDRIIEHAERIEEHCGTS